MKPFQFKYFSIQDDRATMKVGTDAVLLGAWVEVGSAKTILDIGTGSGVIALMMAQRSGFDSHVDAIEIDEASVMQAKENVSRSPWSEKITIEHTSLQSFKSGNYDLIVCNPPYFNKSLLPPSASRQAARHTQSLSFEELLVSAKRLLNPSGIFAVILPFTEGGQLKSMALSSGLNCHRSMAFYSRKGKPQERWLMEFSLEGRRVTTEPETIVLYTEGERWSEGYVDLTRDFYIR
ncbi:MAG TPA: methyltransferase [Cyclobacteriaceae bacterium]|nr:methyltransferase [Cyclobacteriaceae bacterium]